MRWLTENWYKVSVFCAGACAVALALGDWDLRSRTILAATAVLFLHFFEEFGFPGGFPWVGLHVEMHIEGTDARQWPLNRLNAMFGNWWYAAVVYLLALVLPGVRFLTLAVALFAFLEVLMHVVVFNAALRTWYNPGLVTAAFGLMPISIAYLVRIAGAGLYTWVDVVLAFVWIVFNYWVAFRSPIYAWMGRKSDRYAFSDEEVMLARRYMGK
ncbi:MAG: HXXEE domain-containing protein [Coriobacteriales bacterium]|jgi:hypothetical protein